ncbi:MAG: hypothetical protein KF893_15115 [Caldilineaceae bacterium]|nr:hypothetical protein [Caldilineaceae bacterium]
MTTNQTLFSPWLPTGAWMGGTVTAALWAGDVLLAAARAGIFRSEDGGQSWRRSGAGMADPSVVELAATVGDSPILFASTESGRLYRSTDGGLHWQEVEGWAGLGVATVLALSPHYAQDHTIFAATVDGPFRSQDDGATWESATFGLVDVEVLTMAIDPRFAENETLWLGTAGGGLYRSRNGGRSWRDAGSGLPDTAMQALLALPHGNGTNLYLGTESDGLFHSHDGGGSWYSLLPEIGVNALAALPDGSRLIAATDDGILFSEDSGLSWQPAEDGDSIVLALAVNAYGQILAATWQEGISLSTDGGQRWQQLGGGSLAVHAPPLAVLTPAGEIFAADIDGGWSYSTDEGTSWQPVDVAIDAPISVLNVGGSDADFVLMAGSGHTLLRRRANHDWESLDLPLAIAQLAISPAGTLYIASEDGALHRSNDDGASWQFLSIPWGRGRVLGIHASEGTDHFLYALSAQGRDGKFSVDVWRSDDNGDGWLDLAGFEVDAPSIPMLALDDAERSLFLATQNRLIRIFIGADGELAVEQDFLEANVRITALAAHAGNVYAASNRGVWGRTVDGTIHLLGRGLEDQIVVAVLPGNDAIYAVTLGGELWKNKGLGTGD